MNGNVISPGQLLRQVRRTTFDVAKEGPEIVREEVGKEVSCTPGCAFCCYQKVTIDLAQGIAVYLLLRSEWTDRLEQKLLMADRELTRWTHARWLSQRRPCVFLKEQEFGRGRCQVYPVRPTACAATFAVGVPSDCAEVGGTDTLSAMGSAALVAAERQMALNLGLGDLYHRTLPGAVLVARAVVEGLLEPEVHKVPMVIDTTDGAADDVCERFDQIADQR